MSMKQMEEMLPSNIFQRIHKSFIANLTKVTALRKTQLMINKIELPLSENYKTTVGQFFKINL
jgi:DNA-binding LytR/AlgR family response regulator